MIYEDYLDIELCCSIVRQDIGWKDDVFIKSNG